MNQIKNSHIFVTGGAGFVGSHLVEELLAQHPTKLYILDNLFRGSRRNMAHFINNPRVEFIAGDIRDEKTVDKLMARADFCFHLAALRINACAANPRLAFDVMVKSTFNVIESARKNKIKKIIYSSSASVYGMAAHFPTPETDNPYDNQTFYGAAKLFGEQILRSYYHMYDLNYVALRYFNIYGPRMDTDGKYTEVMIKWLDCIKNKQNPVICGGGKTSMDFVFVSDVARANVAALQAEVTDEVFNIGSGKETSLRELLALILKVNHARLTPEFTAESKVNPVRRRLADIRKAKKMLKFSPKINLEKGLKLLSEWYFSKSE